MVSNLDLEFIKLFEPIIQLLKIKDFVGAKKLFSKTKDSFINLDTHWPEKVLPLTLHTMYTLEEFLSNTPTANVIEILSGFEEIKNEVMVFDTTTS